jgi:autotransporter-associated beta strand protein
MKPRLNPFLALALGIASLTTLHADVFTWDTVSGDNIVTGGAGTWDTATAGWTTDAGATNVAWPSSGTDNDAVFGTPAGLVTIAAGGVAANDLTFDLTGYTVAGGTLTLNGTSNIITSTVPAAANSNVHLTISAALAGTNGFTKDGLGHVYLSGNNTGLSGTLTINTATGTQTSGVTLSGANAPGELTQIDVNGGGVTADGSFLSLENTSLASGVTVNLTGQGGTGTIGTLRGSVGNNVVNGPVNINSALVRISSYAGTSLTLNGPVTTTPASNGCYIRFGQNQGVIFTNTSNSWSGVTNLGEGSVYFYPDTLPSTTALLIGSSNPADFGTNGSFTRALGNAAGQIYFGRANNGQRALGFSARGGNLTVNLGGAGGDVVFLNTFAKTGATNATTTVTVDTTNLVVGMSVTGSGIPNDTLISAIGTGTITLNKAATSTVASNALTFYAPQDNTRLNSSVLVLNGANADSALTFENPLDLNGFNRFLQVNTNTTTLTGGMKNTAATAAAVRKTGAGTLVHDPGAAHTLTLAGLNTNGGTLELKSGTITVSGSASTSQPDSATGFTVARGGTFRLNGGNITATSGTYIFPAGNTGGGNSSFILDSGTFNANGREVLNAYGAAGTTTINGGLFICNGFKVTQNTGFLNLNGGTLRVNRLYGDANTSTINFNGGTLQARQDNTGFINTTITNALIQSEGAVIDSNGFAITIPKALTEDSGSTGGGLTKLGNGTLTLTADNTYTGATSVTAGTLALVGGSQTSPITVESGAALGFTLGSPTTSTSTVTFSGATGKVNVTGTPVAATLMTATEITGNPVLDPAIPGFALAIEGGGTLLNLIETSGTPFETWATTNGLAGDDALPGADPDNDGLDNLIEFVIGGQPNPANPNADSSSLAPTVSTDASSLIFTFRRTELALSQPGIVIAAEYGSNLSDWATAIDGVDGVTMVTTEDHYGEGIDRIVVTIPKALATGAKMFARLNVEIP